MITALIAIAATVLVIDFAILWPILKNLRVINADVLSRIKHLEAQSRENCVAVDAVSGSLADTPEMLSKRQKGMYTAVLPRAEAQRAGLQPKQSAHA